jgi:hypothetical protein
MLEWLDWLATWWLNWRTDQSIKSNPAIQEMGFKKANLTPEGMDMVIHAPALMGLCDEAASLLNAKNAENYLEFSLWPRWDHARKPIRVTIQWMHGKSPAQKASELERELLALKAEREPTP